MNFKKIAITFLAIICVSSVNAERMSRTFIAILQSNGHWEYQSVSDSESEVWVKVINPRNGCCHEQTWRLDPNRVKSGNTTLRIKEQQDSLEETHSFYSDFESTKEFRFLSNCIDYAVSGDFVKVWHYNNFTGFGFCIQFLMSDNVTERYCIETFLNEVKDGLQY